MTPGVVKADIKASHLAEVKSGQILTAMKNWGQAMRYLHLETSAIYYTLRCALTLTAKSRKISTTQKEPSTLDPNVVLGRDRHRRSCRCDMF